MYKDIDELHAQEERSRNQAIEDITGISKKYFDTLYEACANIAELRDSLKVDINFLRALNNSPFLESEDLNEGLNEFICVDALRCYRGMEIPVNPETQEYLGLFLLTGHLIGDNFYMRYDSILRHQELMKGHVNFYALLTDLSERIGDEENLFVASFLPKGSELYKQYYALFYRWALLVSKADKVTTKKEQEWLLRLKCLQDAEIESKPTIIAEEEKSIIKETNSEESPITRLHGMIGLDSVKNEVETLYNFIKVQKQREKMGMKTSAVSYHCIFTGNAGTGKTTVARIVAQIYKELGVLKKGHLVETDRSGLVAEYVGQTAIKTNKIIDSALDGVLFIDEAYALSQGGREDFGKEAISTLIKRMEDDRDRLVVILAGYEEDMSSFLNSNLGIQSRINRYIHFPDYSEDELFQIFMSLANKSEYHITPEAQAKLRFIIEAELEKRDPKFGNARYIRNLFEKTIEHQANRLSSISDITPELLSTITISDL